MYHPRDLTIDDVLQDKMIGMLLKADRVDRKAFEAMLRCLAEANAAGDEQPEPIPQRVAMSPCVAW